VTIRRFRPPVPLWVFVILLTSYAYFWQARDWNSASRLMLTYALVDRGTFVLNGLEDQTHDRAYVRGRWYCDKLPGFSLLAVPPYFVAKSLLRLPDHPLNRPGFAYWPADYWVTLATSGLSTALIGALLAILARDLGCGPRRSALVGLAYGLATPAYAYATMSYGHQPAALALLASFALLWKPPPAKARLRAAAAGALAALAAVIEMQVGPVSAILGLYLIVQVAGRRWAPSAIGAFALGAAGPTLVLLAYNLLAFGSPWDMGYFHLVTPEFAKMHSARNPLGLRRPEWERAIPLLWGRYRGLFFYAPITILAVPGWVVMAARRYWGATLVSLSTAFVVFLVNLSYPAWTGGWTTGPRLLVPMLPFLMLPVAALLAVGGRLATWLAVGLALAGGILLLLFLGVGSRIPQWVSDPLVEVVWPQWRGDPIPLGGNRFTRNPAAAVCPGLLARLPASLLWLQFLPLVAFQGLAILAMVRATGGGKGTDDG
jgi:hypothetical protein